MNNNINKINLILKKYIRMLKNISFLYSAQQRRI